MIETKYSDSQPRDDHGKWTSGGSSSAAADQANSTAHTLGNLVGAAATAGLAAAMLAAALRRPQKIVLQRAASTLIDPHGEVRRLLEQSLGGHVLTDAEKAVMRKYTSGESSNLNKKIRAGTVGKFDNPHLIPQLDSLINKTSLPRDVVLYRGIRGKYADGLKEGDIFGDKAYQSTSYSQTVGEQFAAKDKNGVLVMIQAKKGSKALPINGHSHFDTEHEILLPRNSVYRVIGREGRTLHVELT